MNIDESRKRWLALSRESASHLLRRQMESPGRLGGTAATARGPLADSFPRLRSLFWRQNLRDAGPKLNAGGQLLGRGGRNRPLQLFDFLLIGRIRKDCRLELTFEVDQIAPRILPCPPLLRERPDLFLLSVGQIQPPQHRQQPAGPRSPLWPTSTLRWLGYHRNRNRRSQNHRRDGRPYASFHV